MLFTSKKNANLMYQSIPTAIIPPGFDQSLIPHRREFDVNLSPLLQAFDSCRGRTKLVSSCTQKIVIITSLGHYVTDVATLLQFHKNGKTIRALPPSAILEAAYNNGNGGLPNLEHLAKRCCLTEQQIQMWWDHLQQNAMNRAKGVENAKAT